MKTLKQVDIIPIYVKEIPSREDMKFGEFYICLQYFATNHLCLCGCGHQCYLPINKDGWRIGDTKENKLTITPSILQRFECKSHYIITNNIANFV